MSDDTAVQHVATLVDNAKICMLTTAAADGRYVSRPMGLQEVEFDGDLWFFAYADSAKVAQIAADPRVNVSFANTKNSEWTSIAGTAAIVRDPAKAKELWSAPLKIWFPDGVETPGLVLIKVHADSAEYWDSPDSKVRQLFGAARAAVTNNPDAVPGTNREVDL